MSAQSAPHRIITSRLLHDGDAQPLARQMCGPKFARTKQIEQKVFAGLLYEAPNRLSLCAKMIYPKTV